MFYNLNENKLYRYDISTQTWSEINWKNIVKASPEFQAGKLRINSSTGKLEISPDDTNWYECIPAIGSNVIKLQTLDNQTFSYKYWIAPGCTAIVENTNHIPIVFSRNSMFTINIDCPNGNGYGGWFLYLSDIQMNTYVTEIANNATTSYAYCGNGTTKGIRFAMLELGGYNGSSVVNLFIRDNSYTAVNLSYFSRYNYGVGILSYWCPSLPSSAYWIGTSNYEGGGYQYFSKCSITRLA